MAFKARKSRKKITILVVLSVVFAYLVLAFAFKFWPFQKHITITATSVENSLPSNNGGSSNAENGTNSNNTSQSTDNNPKSPTQTDATTKTLIAPSGTFVNLYNASADTQMNSICNTTAGATCQIAFTKGNLTIALPVKTADGSGVASWAWTPQQIGLTTGKWHVTAKATLGSQTKTTDNGSLELVIQ